MGFARLRRASRRARVANVAVVLLLLAGTLPAARCDDDLGRFPGSMWIQARDRSDLVDEPDNGIVEGAIQQGIDLIDLGQHTRLNAFVEYQGKRDEQALDWNRKHLWSIGGKLRFTGIERTLISVGARYDVDRRVESGEARNGFTGFLSWGSYWDLGQITAGDAAAIGAVGLPGTTWGELRYPSSHFGEESTVTVLEGAVEQGIDWTRLFGAATFNTFARLEYALDSKGLDWNNKLKVAPGAKIKIDVGTRGLLELGLQYQWHHRFESDRTRNGAVLFANWNLAWDLGEFARKSY